MSDPAYLVVLQRMKALENLRKWLRHEPDCKIDFGKAIQNCTCGLTAARVLVEEDELSRAAEKIVRMNEPISRDDWAEDVDGGLRIGMKDGVPWMSTEPGTPGVVAIVLMRAQALHRRANRMFGWLVTCRGCQRGEPK